MQYTSVDEAMETRKALYNIQWPPNNGGRLLVAEFVDPQEVKMRAEAPPQSPAAPTPPAPAPPASQPQPSHPVNQLPDSSSHHRQLFHHHHPYPTQPQLETLHSSTPSPTPRKN
ncbi:hypothetical protein Pint_26675 [Pistacia integerrima]|uniref:Uncharacterized protein n=1 Tax=Pistacia integerrima TaxID=434235 RepID=A0ACC0YT76_9ROSI|nr:hypothetical protein Pint_26675 [Pistacia integerrima]